MPAASTRRSTSPALRLPPLLLRAVLAASLPCSVVAQEEKLNLRRSEQLSIPSPPGANVAGPRESEPLRLRSAPGLASEVARTVPQRVTEMLLQADVNQQRLDDPVIVLKAEDGTMLLAGEDLDRWRLRRPDSAPFEYGGKLYYPVPALPGLRIAIDERRQTLSLIHISEPTRLLS